MVKKKASQRASLHLISWFGLTVLLLATSACAPAPIDRPWTYSDLRLISSTSTSSPATDILAVYTRTTFLSVDIRVDLLDINVGDTYLLKLTLWDDRNLAQNPLLITISSTGMVQTSKTDEGKPAIWPRVFQNHSQDTITISLNRFLIGERYHLDVSTYTTDPEVLADQVLHVRSDGQPPVNRAPALVAFWDAFPVTTPAQALRSWSGAHTGPLGDRHGLSFILAGAGQYNVPVVLLDVKQPASLAALNFMGNIPRLKDLYVSGLLVLPDVAYAEPADTALDLSRRASAGFDLPTSQFLYAPAADPSALRPPSSGYRAEFMHLADDAHLASSGGLRFIPLPPADAIQATENGPSVDVRRALIQAAISSDPADLVVLGGSLPKSTWGDSDMAGPTFAWIAAHPWIQPLSGQDLLTFPTGRQAVDFTPVETQSPWQEELRSAPKNSVTLSAWQTYLTLSAPSAEPQFQALQSAYLGQVGQLLAAADWAEHPILQSDCKDDLNQDGKAECVLSDQNFFAVLDPAGARLSLFFYRDANGPHQVVGPSSQFAVGLSDPSVWHLEDGEAADPSVIPGAFLDDTHAWARYTPAEKPGEIAFSDPDSGRIKTYRLLEDGIQVNYLTSNPVGTRVPLALDPQAFFFGPTNYRATLTPNSWTWKLSDGGGVEVRSDAVLSAQGFISALPFVSLNEDPNLQYPLGNYLPFPLSVVSIQSEGPFYVEIHIK